MKDTTMKIDWVITIIPFITILIMCMLFFVFPLESNVIISQVRFFLGDTMGSYYLVIGLGIFLFSLFLAFSKYGSIILGKQNDRPKYSFFTWGAMMFTAGLAADILFYSFSEWILYATDKHIEKLGGFESWASVFPLFHWSFIPWGFYLVLAVAFGFMMHVRKSDKQKFSEACRPLLGKYTDKLPGRIIDLLAVFALIAGTATTFSLATPLMANVINVLFNTSINRNLLTIIILLITCIVYTYSLLHGFKGISLLAKGCVYIFLILLLYVFFLGGETKFIFEMGIESLGRMLSNFIELSTFTDPYRETLFPQNWTLFYWAYWMVWSVAAPFFIGQISEGRTIKQTILGGYGFGVGSTILSFVILGNYPLKKQIDGTADFISYYLKDGDLYNTIIEIIKTLPAAEIVLIMLLLAMIAFYATSFDSIALIASYYSYRTIPSGKIPNKIIEFMWCILLILLPIALVFSSSSMNNLQSVSIIAAFPLGIVIILIAISLIKELQQFSCKDN